MDFAKANGVSQKLAIVIENRPNERYNGKGKRAPVRTLTMRYFTSRRFNNCDADGEADNDGDPEFYPRVGRVLASWRLP